MHGDDMPAQLLRKIRASGDKSLEQFSGCCRGSREREGHGFSRAVRSYNGFRL